MTGDIYHIVNRGVGKGNILNDDKDSLRFVNDLYRFNNKEFPLSIRNKSESFFVDPPKQNKIVEILKWALMPNHYHLLLMEIVDGGAIEFVKRLGNGYTKYFNIKHKRSGYLFQNSAKIIRTEDLPHFLYLPFYIDSNPIKLIEPNWKESGIKNINTVMSFLVSYDLSSYKDYKNIKNFSFVINKELFYETFNTNGRRYENEFKDWLGNYVQPATSDLPR